jgi:hypothetical protein
MKNFLTFNDLFILIKKNINFVLRCIFFGMMIGLFLAYFMPTRYEGKILLSKGRFMDKQYVADQFFISALRQQSFYSNESLKACLDKNNSSVLPDFRDINFDIDKEINNSDYDNVISIKVRGSSRQIVSNCLRSVFKDIQEYSSTILNPLIESKNHEIEQESITLTSLKEEFNSSEKFNNNKLGNLQIAYLLETRLMLLSKIANKETSIAGMKEKLKKPFTNNANLVVPIFVEYEPNNFSSRILVVLLSTILGPFFSILTLIARKK